MSFDIIKSIHLASDHAGFSHKEAVRIWLEDSIYNVIDHGDNENQPDDDFPDFISKAAKAVSDSPDDAVAIIFGGSGQGEAMLANRFPNVRAAVYYGGDRGIIALAREHNNANIISFGARFVTVEEVKSGILTWLSTPALSDEKYQRRNQKIEAITKQIYKA